MKKVLNIFKNIFEIIHCDKENIFCEKFNLEKNDFINKAQGAQ